MSRPREFNDEKVTHAIADLFTAHGYAGTSMGMLTNATGLGKQSLYNAFGDKEAMYLQAIDCSVDRFGRHLAGIEQATSGRHAIELFFSTLTDLCTSDDPAKKNCIVSSGFLEGIEGASIAGKLDRVWHSNHQFLSALARRGQTDQSVRSDMPADDIADLLMALMSGLRVSARAIKRSVQIKKIAQSGLEFLKPSARA